LWFYKQMSHRWEKSYNSYKFKRYIYFIPLFFNNCLIKFIDYSQIIWWITRILILYASIAWNMVIFTVGKTLYKQHYEPQFWAFWCFILTLDQRMVLVMGLGQNFFGSGWVSHLWFGFGKFPLKIPNFSIFFPSSQKNIVGLGLKVPGSKMVQPLIYCGSKACSGQARVHLYMVPWIELLTVQFLRSSDTSRLGYGDLYS